MRILQNFGFLSAGKLLGDLFTFLLFVVLSRYYGQEGLGQYSFAMAIGGFMLVLSDFGLYPYSVKEISRQDGRVGVYYGKIHTLRLALAGVVVLGLLLVLPWLPFPYELKLIIALLGVQQVLYGLVDGFAAVFVAREDMHLAGLLEFTLRAVGSLTGIAVVYMGGTLVMALAALPLAALLQASIAYWAVSRKYGRPRLGLSWLDAKQALNETFPFGIARLLAQIAARMDVLLLGFLLGTAAAGIYNAAYRIVFMLMFISYFASMALFPGASRLYLDNPGELKAFYQKAMNMIILFSLPVAAGVWLVAPDLIRLVYGSEFQESGVILRFLAWLILFSFLQNTLGTFLTASDRQVERTKSQWIVAWVNGLGNLLLIPLLGIRGAAMATLFSEGLMVVLLLLRLKNVLGLPSVSSRFIMSLIATAAFCIPFFFFWHPSLFLIVPASVVIYFSVLTLFKEFRINEGRLIFRALNRGKS